MCVCMCVCVRKKPGVISGFASAVSAAMATTEDCEYEMLCKK